MRDKNYKITDNFKFYEFWSNNFGKEKVVQMKQVAKDLINGDEISYPIYEEVKKKKFGLF